MDLDRLVQRPYRPQDAAAVAAHANRIAIHAGGHGGLTETLVSEFATRLRDPESDTRETLTQDGELVADAWVLPPAPTGHVVTVFGGVHPAWRGRGLGRATLAWQLERAAALRREIAPAATGWQAHTSAMADDRDAARLFQRFGLRPVRYWFTMVAPTGGADLAAAALPDRLRLVDYPPGREVELHRAHEEAFADHWGFQPRPLADWATLTVRSHRFVPRWSVLVVAGDEIAGYLLGYRAADPDEVYVGQVGVRPAWRRRGLATAMLAEVLARSAADGRKQAVLGVDADSPTGAVALYERIGFAVDRRSVTYSVPLPD